MLLQLPPVLALPGPVDARAERWRRDYHPHVCSLAAALANARKKVSWSELSFLDVEGSKQTRQTPNTRSDGRHFVTVAYQVWTFSFSSGPLRIKNAVSPKNRKNDICDRADPMLASRLLVSNGLL
jgi:hypothetical protein